jgi:hypothetical protein
LVRNKVIVKPVFFAELHWLLAQSLPQFTVKPVAAAAISRIRPVVIHSLVESHGCW